MSADSCEKRELLRLSAEREKEKEIFLMRNMGLICLNDWHNICIVLINRGFLPEEWRADIDKKYAERLAILDPP